MEAKEHVDQPPRRWRTPTGRREGPHLRLKPFSKDLPAPLVVTAPDGRIRLVNRIAEDLFGYPHDELVGQPVQVLWAERARARYTRNMELYFATKHPVRFSTEVWGRRPGRL